MIVPRAIWAVLFVLLGARANPPRAHSPPPADWDAKACAQRAAAHGPEGACRQCTDAELGFGAAFGQKVEAQLDRHKITGSVGNSKGGATTWLRIAIATVPRTNDMPYLERVLLNIADELGGVGGGDLRAPVPASIDVVTANFRPGKHKVFERIRSTLSHLESSHAAKAHFRFLELDPVLCDPSVPESWEYKPSLSPEVAPRQQTRDVVALMRAALQVGNAFSASAAPTCENMLLMEDDFELCPGGLTLVKHAINKAQRDAWSGIRVGIAGNGIIIPCSDVMPLTRYLLKNQYMMPVDLLFAEWFLRIHKDAKQHLHDGHKFRINQVNLFHHIGSVSSFSDGRGQRRVAGCGDMLITKSWMKGESFDNKCRAVGMSPCTSKGIANNRALKIAYQSKLPKGALPGNVEPVKSKPGESCDEACARVSDNSGATVGCAQGEFYHLNSCRYLRRFFGKCRNGCLKISGDDDLAAFFDDVSAVPLNAAPGALALDDGKDATPHLCWHHATDTGQGEGSISKLSTCGAKAEHIERICPCRDGSIPNHNKK